MCRTQRKKRSGGSRGGSRAVRPPPFLILALAGLPSVRAITTQQRVMMMYVECMYVCHTASTGLCVSLCYFQHAVSPHQGKKSNEAWTPFCFKRGLVAAISSLKMRPKTPFSTELPSLEPFRPTSTRVLLARHTRTPVDFLSSHTPVSQSVISGGRAASHSSRTVGAGEDA